ITIDLFRVGSSVIYSFFSSFSFEPSGFLSFFLSPFIFPSFSSQSLGASSNVGYSLGFLTAPEAIAFSFSFNSSFFGLSPSLDETFLLPPEGSSCGLLPLLTGAAPAAAASFFAACSRDFLKSNSPGLGTPDFLVPPEHNATTRGSSRRAQIRGII
ncbi:hypothetical protein PFISCL1PPCAC_12022, partial [Pristionchus fissidentatus]